MKELIVAILFVLIAFVGSSRSALFGNGAAAPSDGIVVSGQATSTNSVTGETGEPKTKIEKEVSKEVPVKKEVVKTPVVVASDFPITMSDVSAGSTVTVPSVSFDAPGWVAIREKGTAGTTFGVTLGATWLPKGDHKNVMVELLRPTLAGGTYFVVLHSDNGDRKYERANDPIITLLGVGNAAVSFKAN
ncbi:MAG: hypothetical protein V4674_02445 [Patescibacteria group bacterium]